MPSQPEPMEFVFQIVLDYTKIDGTRAQHVIYAAIESDGLERMNRSIAVAKAANYGHDMQERITVIPPMPYKDKMTKSQWRSECAQAAYFRRHAPESGRALGYC